MATKTKTKTKGIVQIGVQQNRYVGLAEIFNRFFQLLLLLIISVSLVGGGIYLYDYYYSQVNQVDQQLAAKQQELSRKQQDLENIRELRVDYQALEADAQGLFDALPDTAELPNLYLQIIGLAEVSNLTIESFNVSEPPMAEEENGEGLQEVVININLIGNDYAVFNGFLENIEKSLRIIDVTSINYDSREDAFSVILKTYYKVEG